MREEYVRRQDGLCMYCSKSLSEEPVMDKKINWNMFPEGFLNYPVHLDHDHSTGLTRGAVHAYCNAVMWQYEGK